MQLDLTDLHDALLFASQLGGWTSTHCGIPTPSGAVRSRFSWVEAAGPEGLNFALVGDHRTSPMRYGLVISQNQVPVHAWDVADTGIRTMYEQTRMIAAPSRLQLLFLARPDFAQQVLPELERRIDALYAQFRTP